MALGPVDAQFNLGLGNRENFNQDEGVTRSDYKPLRALNLLFLVLR